MTLTITIPSIAAWHGQRCDPNGRSCEQCLYAYSAPIEIRFFSLDRLPKGGSDEETFTSIHAYDVASDSLRNLKLRRSARNAQTNQGILNSKQTQSKKEASLRVQVCCNSKNLQITQALTLPLATHLRSPSSRGGNAASKSLATRQNRERILRFQMLNSQRQRLRNCDSQLRLHPKTAQRPAPNLRLNMKGKYSGDFRHKGRGTRNYIKKRRVMESGRIQSR